MHTLPKAAVFAIYFCMKLIDSALRILEQAVQKDFHGNLKEAAARLDVSYHTLYSWLGPRRTRTPLGCVATVSTTALFISLRASASKQTSPRFS